jgi:hypothetical protein
MSGKPYMFDNPLVKNREEQFEEHAVPFAAKKGMGVVAMKVIRPRESVKGIDPAMLIRYSLSSEYFSLANIGTDNIEVLEKNLEIVRDFEPLNNKQMDEVQAALDPFFRHENVA